MKRIAALFAILILSAATTTLLLAMPLTFTISDDSSYGLGDVTVAWNGGSGQVNVPSPGSYPASAPGAVTSVTINGQTLVAPNSGSVTLSNGARLLVSWVSNGIDVIDYTVINSPAP